MKNPFLLFAIWALSCPQLFSQRAFSPGWIVSTSGDTLTGAIRNASRRELCREVHFQTTGQSHGVRYTPDMLRAFYSEETGLFESAEVAYFENPKGGTQSRDLRRRHFVRRVIGGPTSLFMLEVNEGDFYYVRSTGDSLQTLPSCFILLDKKNQPSGLKIVELPLNTPVEVEKDQDGCSILRTSIGHYRPVTTFRTVLRRVMADCPSISISPEMECNERTLTKVIRRYNECKGYKETLASTEGKPVRSKKSGVLLQAGAWADGLVYGAAFDFGFERNFRIHPELLLQYYQPTWDKTEFGKGFIAFVPRFRYDFVRKQKFGLNLIVGVEAYFRGKGADEDSFAGKDLRPHAGIGSDVYLGPRIVWHTEVNIPLAPQGKTGVQIRF